jgi:hypothetical protein
MLGFLLIGGVLPAIFLVAIGQAFRPDPQGPERFPDWLGFLGLSSCLLLGAILGAYLIAGEKASWIVLILMPSICGLIAEFLLFLVEQLLPWLNRQNVQKLGWPLVIFLFNLILLAGLSRFLDSFTSGVVLIGGTILALAWLLLKRLGKWQPVFYVVQILLLLFSLWATDIQGSLIESPAWLGGITSMLVFLIPGIAIIWLAHILGWVMRDDQAFSRRKVFLGVAVSIPVLLLIVLQVATASAWDVATDGLGGLVYLELTAFLGIASAILLAWDLPVPRRSPAFVFAIILPVIVMGANTFGTYGFDGAWGNVPRMRTERRAASINRAILRYHERQGMYPAALSDLTPGYLLFVPHPFIIPDQDWCYQGGPGYYRLGYVYRDYFSSLASVKVYAEAGTPPVQAWPCDEQVAKYPAP